MGTQRAGPPQGPIQGVADLARRVTERVGAVETFRDLRAGVRAGLFPADASVFIKGHDRLRLQVKNPLTGEDIGKVILSENEFLLENLRKKKGYRGEADSLLAKELPDLGLSHEDLSPMKLFFPSFREKSDEASAMLAERSRYVAEFWRPESGPTMQVEVDSWSLTPVAMKLYCRGSVLVEIRWSRLTWLEEHGLVIPLEVRVRLPEQRRTIKITVSEPKINVDIPDRAFRLRETPGIEVETWGGGPEEGPSGAAGRQSGCATDDR